MGFLGTLWNGIKGIGSAIFGGFGSSVGSSIGSSIAGGVSTAISTKQQMNYAKELMALQNKYNVQNAKTSYNYSKSLQDYQNAFTSRMTSTAHQIEVNDLRRAGLNPILSATGGSGAVVPGAGNASVSVNGVSGQSAPDVDYLGSALALREQKNSNKRTDADTWLSRKQSSYYGELARNEAEKFDSIVQDRVNSIATTSAQVKYWNQLAKSAEMDSLSRRIDANANAMSSASQAYYNHQLGIGQSYRNVRDRYDSEFYTQHPKQAGFLRGVGAYMDTFGKLVKPR